MSKAESPYYTASADDYKPLPQSPEDSVVVAELKVPQGISEASIKRHGRWTIALCFYQLILAGLDLFFNGAILTFAITTLFTYLGLRGVTRLSRRPLLAHFIYSHVVVLLDLIFLFLAVFYCRNCTIFGLLTSSLILLIQVLMLRQERKLLYELNFLSILRAASELHDSQTTSSDVEQGVEMKPTETAAPTTETKNEEQENQPVPQPVPFNFYPMPYPMALPQGFPPQSAAFQMPYGMPYPVYYPQPGTEIPATQPTSN